MLGQSEFCHQEPGLGVSSNSARTARSTFRPLSSSLSILEMFLFENIWQTLLGLNGALSRYELTLQLFAGLNLAAFPERQATLLIDAPFGRFSLGNSPLSFNANLCWFIMELFSPITFLLSLVQSPFLLSAAAPSDLGSLSVFSLRMHNLTTPTKILVALYLVHYANRSTVSVLRNPSKRSPMHLATFVASVAFNIANGFLMGSWIGGRTRSLLDLSLMPKSGGVDEPALRSPLFWTGLALWAAGFVGNMISDEILFDIRRPDPTGKPKPRYAVPRGFLYSRPLGGISFPNYFTEWFEWFGFALACSTVGSAPVIPPHADAWLGTDVIPSISFLQYLTPPWLFFLSEILVMTPRALRGHQWYREKFGQEMPQARKAVIPGLL